MTNTAKATAFLQMAASGKVQEAYEEYIHPKFIHHNPYFKGDRQALLEAMKAAHKKTPNKLFEIQRVLEEGDLVAVHSRVVQENGVEIAVVHILRFEDDKIVELWDLGIAVPEDTSNENGLF